MADSNPFDKFDSEPSPAGANRFDRFGSNGPVAEGLAARRETMTVPSRPREFVSAEDQPARMVTRQRGSREVPKEGPIDRAIYEAGGRTTDALSSMGLPPEAAAAGGYLTNLGGQVATTFAGGNMGAKVEPALQNLGQKTMQWALKPNYKEIDSGKAGRAAKTLLDEGAGVTTGGMEKLSKDIDLINTQIQDVIKNSTDTVNKYQVAANARRSYEKWKYQVNNASDINAVKTAVRDFLNDPAIAEYMPVQLAQRLKTGTYRSLGEKAYEPGQKGITASIDAQKDLANGLKQRIEYAHPEVGPLNSREGRLIEAREMGERALAKSEARDKVGFGWLANHPESAVGWMAERSPAIKSMLARYFAHHADPEMAGRAVGAAAGAYSGSAPPSLERELGR